MSTFSFSHGVFKRIALQTRICAGKGLPEYKTNYHERKLNCNQRFSGMGGGAIELHQQVKLPMMSQCYCLYALGQYRESRRSFLRREYSNLQNDDGITAKQSVNDAIVLTHEDRLETN